MLKVIHVLKEYDSRVYGFERTYAVSVILYWTFFWKPNLRHG
jgi:hypothetical protein